MKNIRKLVMLLALMAPVAVWGQPDYSGVYYIASRDYVEANTTTNYYLCPTEEWAYYQSSSPYYYVYTSGCNTDMPFMTTYQCRNGVYDSRNAVWIIEKAPAPNDAYYHIRRAIDGKYLTYNVAMANGDKGRMRIHLEATADGDNALFQIIYISGSGPSTLYEITTKNSGPDNDNRKYMNVCGPKGGNGNIQELQGTNARADGPTNCKNVGGIIGLWTATGDNNGKWYLEEAVKQPVISQAANGDITITCATGSTTIYYTLDDSDPEVPADGAADPTGPTYKYTTTFTPEIGSTGVKAVAVLSSMHAAVSKKAELSFSAYTTPTITFNNTTNEASISSEGTVYYTTNGEDPAVDPSSLIYSDPFTITSTTTVKAIAIHSGYLTSDIATTTIDKVATPSIQDNGSNAVSITCATDGATIYYTTDGSTPTTSSTEYTGPLTDGVSGVTIKAIAVKENMIPSAVGSGSVTLQCATPVITRVDMTFTLSCSMPTDATLHYTIDDGSETVYSGAVAFTSEQLPITVTAWATHNDYTTSAIASREISSGDGSPSAPYQIYNTTDLAKFVTDVNNGTTSSACYILMADLSASDIGEITTTFSGTFEAAIDPATHMPYRITNLSAPLFTTLTGTVRNLVIESVAITSGDASGNTGAIACTANGTARIYNVGILAGSVGGSNYVGGLVGLLDGEARVINCYSYADITQGDYIGGIVGYNNQTTTAASIKTMVMNCMFYGDITGGTTVSPVFGGTNIANLNSGGLNTFNYYAYDELQTTAISNNKYNSALAVEEKFLKRHEFYRLLLNSNKKLAAFYVTGDVADANLMLKWVLETADRTIDDPKPYPILKAQGYYPSIINPDIANAPDSATVGRNHGGKLGRTLAVTISNTKTTGGQSWPTGANITTTSLTLQRTDKDFDRFNYNYDKVQLPYYNDVGTGNYTDNRVVTGWKITAITAVPGDPYTSANYPTTGIRDFPDHNYADRRSSNKDLYSVSGRVFSQGAYFDVPYGVTSITIEPYWGNAIYVADTNYDVVYKADYSGKQNVTLTGTQAVDNTTEFNGQKIRTSITGLATGTTVYDNAVVLVGNFHLDGVPSGTGGTTPFTIMSVDADNDHEPDYSLIYHHKGRTAICPIRFDFLNIPGTAQAQKPNGASLICNFTIFKTKGWFETTNTALFYTSQLEYENQDGVTKSDAPLILLGGVVDQFVSTQSKAVTGKTIYIHVGGNVWINEFGMGTHSDGAESTPHVPVSVTGGEFPGFYLTGTYKADAKVRTDNAECYISGGYIHEAAGASLEQIDGNVRWQIYNADIDNFFGGGINDDKPIKGDITTEIYNSHVTLFCGGPKFGNMQANKTVTTRAEGCVFGTYFGAGYGGTSIAKKKYYDKDGDQNWGTLQSYYTTDRGKYFDGSTTQSSQTSGKDYGKKGPGVATDFDYEFFVWTSGATGARLYVKFAAFSLAQCNKVSSSLKRCTIENNYYGGGSLGKVVDSVTSMLDSCTVMGNVFGAGFSASLPTLQVRNGGFTKNPNYNQGSGMFEPGIFTGTTEYYWKHVNTLTNNTVGISTSNDTNYVHTTVDLEHLGTVNGNVTLTIGGNSIIGTDGDATTGSVYGGGEESAVDGNTNVILKGNTEVFGNVYGGGNKGTVTGNTNVSITK